MTGDITKRIERELGLPQLIENLEKLSGSDLHSVLLTLLKRRVRQYSCTSLLAPNAATQACSLDGRQLNKMESLAYECSVRFEAVQLSPVLPLGAVSLLTGLDQGNVLSSIRTLEAASDPTVGLAIECAQRRKLPVSRKAAIRLCTSQRVMRFPLPQTKSYTAHFNLFSLVTAGRDSGSFSFELAALCEQLDCYLTYMSELNNRGYDLSGIRVELSDTRVVSHLCDRRGIDKDEIKSQVRARDSQSSQRLLSKHGVDWKKALTESTTELAQFNLPGHLIFQLELLRQQVLSILQEKYQNISFEFNLHRLSGLSYYKGPCFHIKANNQLAETFMLADGGFVNWTQVLLGDKKERLLTSAIGTELLCRKFRS